MGAVEDEVDELTLEGVTKAFGENHAKKKDAEAQLKRKKTQFFDLATETCIEEGLATTTVKYSGESTFGKAIPDDLAEYVATWHPGWRLVEAENDKLILEEDPEVKEFTFANNEDGKVYWRNQVQGSPELDDDLLQKEDPELWEEASQPAPAQVAAVKAYAEWAGLEDDDYLSYFDDLPRELRPLTEMPDNLLARLANYITPGPITVKMEAPRAIKTDDLGS